MSVADTLLGRKGRGRSIGVIAGDDDAKGLQDYFASFGCNDVFLLLSQRYLPERIRLSANYFRQQRRYAPGRYDVLVNSISDPDHNARTLEVAARLARESGRPVLNAPARIPGMTRERVAARLREVEGLHVPGIIRVPRGEAGKLRAAAERADLRWPLIVRRCGTHGGEIAGVVEDPRGLDGLTLDPRAPHYLIEFADFRSPDGFFRKRRIFFIGDRLCPRHLLVSEHWNVHASARKFILGHPDWMAAEAAFVEGGEAEIAEPFRSTLKRVRAAIGLDYFGIDCSFLEDGRILLFECNPAMNLFPFSDEPALAYLKAMLPPALDAMDALIEARIAEAGGPALP
ncbi:MAG: hypothetical protein HXY25_04270 [Alphaproteobacteria bacterium]|nr:hypothetical protein [Alphaproteobacteria bacterium]